MEKYENNIECRICHKKFESKDFFEFHWMTKHTVDNFNLYGFDKFTRIDSPKISDPNIIFKVNLV